LREPVWNPNGINTFSFIVLETKDKEFSCLCPRFSTGNA
jgi:hypothetical protein